MVRIMGIDAQGRGLYDIDEISDRATALKLANKHNNACRWDDDPYRVFDEEGRDITTARADSVPPR
jgi:hypothetical protein